MLQSPGQGKLKQDDVEPGLRKETGAGQVSRDRDKLAQQQFKHDLDKIF